MSDLVKRLNIKAGVMEMGEMIAWGSDTALMREAASYIEELESKLEERKATCIKLVTIRTELEDEIQILKAEKDCMGSSLQWYMDNE